MQVLLLMIMLLMQLVAAQVNNNTITSLDELMHCDATGCLIADVNATFTNLSATQQVLDTRGQNLTIRDSWLYMDQTNPAQLVITVAYNKTLAAEPQFVNATYRP
jgi:hypothetical protein